MRYLILFLLNLLICGVIFSGVGIAQSYTIDKSGDLGGLVSEVYKDVDAKLKGQKEPIKMLFVTPKNESKYISENDVILLDAKLLQMLKKRVTLVERDWATMNEEKGAKPFTHVDLQIIGKKAGTAFVARLMIQDNFLPTPTKTPSLLPDEILFKVIILRSDNGVELANLTYVRKLKVDKYFGGQNRHRMRDIAIGTGAMSFISAVVLSFKANLEKKGYDNAESSGDAKQLRRRTEADKQFAYGCYGISLISAGIAGWIYNKDIKKETFHFELLPPNQNVSHINQGAAPNDTILNSIGGFRGGLTWNF